MTQSFKVRRRKVRHTATVTTAGLTINKDTSAAWKALFDNKANEAKKILNLNIYPGGAVYTYKNAFQLLATFNAGQRAESPLTDAMPAILFPNKIDSSENMENLDLSQFPIVLLPNEEGNIFLTNRSGASITGVIVEIEYLSYTNISKKDLAMLQKERNSGRRPFVEFGYGEIDLVDAPADPFNMDADGTGSLTQDSVIDYEPKDNEEIVLERIGILSIGDADIYGDGLIYADRIFITKIDPEGKDMTLFNLLWDDMASFPLCETRTSPMLLDGIVLRKGNQITIDITHSVDFNAGSEGEDVYGMAILLGVKTVTGGAKV